MAFLLILFIVIAILLVAIAAALGTYLLPSYLLKRFGEIDVEARSMCTFAYMVVMAPIAGFVGLSVGFFIIITLFPP